MSSAGGAAENTRSLRVLINAWRDLRHPLAGGSEVLVDRLATELTARGHTVTLRCGSPVSEHPYRVVDAGGRFEHYLRYPFDYIRNHRRNDVVVDVANGMTYFTPLMRRRPTICFVHHVHTEHWAQWFRPPLAILGRNIERKITPRAYRNNLFVAVSASTAESLESIGVNPEHIRIVNNGVDVPDHFAPESDEPLFVALGRLVPHKRYDLLARVWKLVRAETGGRLVIIGEGPERSRIEAVRAPGLELAGKVSEADKNRLLGEAWMLLHPASLEGWGLVVMEAAARQTPTIGFWSPGVRDSVVHGETGVLVEDQDELASEWIRLASDTRLRHQMGAAARGRAELFTWDKCVDAFEAVAAEALSVPRAARRAMTRQPQPAVTRVTAASMAPRISAVEIRPATSPAVALDTTLVVLVPAHEVPLRTLFGAWRSRVELTRTELVIVAASTETQSSALVDGALAGFERRERASISGTNGTRHALVHANGRVVIVIDASAVNGAGDVFAAASDLREHVTATSAPIATLRHRDDPAMEPGRAWDGLPIALTACAANGSDLVQTLAKLGHFRIRAEVDSDVVFAAVGDRLSTELIAS
jgi:glycosyltransferase involved in cell wall biosynthesis